MLYDSRQVIAKKSGSCENAMRTKEGLVRLEIWRTTENVTVEIRETAALTESRVPPTGPPTENAPIGWTAIIQQGNP